ncbi:MAG TPA: YciI family protein [Usitatibacter sp.]|jgi:hypothetical protein
MRFMVMVRATKTAEADRIPKLEEMQDMGRFNDELQKAGVMLSGDGLRASKYGARVKFTSDNKRSVVDGPFAETKELIAGYWIWKCDSLADAIGWAKKAPSPFPGENCEIEIRRLFEMEDFQ